MIIGKNSLGKGSLLFVGAALVATCIFATFASGSLTLQIIAVVALIATAIGVYKIFKSLER